MSVVSSGSMLKKALLVSALCFCSISLQARTDLPKKISNQPVKSCGLLERNINNLLDIEEKLKSKIIKNDKQLNRIRQEGKILSSKLGEYSKELRRLSSFVKNNKEWRPRKVQVVSYARSINRLMNINIDSLARLLSDQKRYQKELKRIVSLTNRNISSFRKLCSYRSHEQKFGDWVCAIFERAWNRKKES